MKGPLSSPLFARCPFDTQFRRPNLGRVIGLFISAALFLSVLPASAAPPHNTGIVTATGTVTINGHPAISGQTLFPHSEVTTSKNSETLLQLQNSARLNLLPESDLQIDFDRQRVSGFIRQGGMRGYVPLDIRLDLATADLSIIGDSSEPLVFTINASECDGTVLSVRQGRLRVRGPNVDQAIEAGESLTTLPGSQSATPGKKNHLSHNQKLGLWIAIGAATGIVLAVALGQNDEDQETPGGGCVIAPSGSGGSGQCP
jgi:hypothetical protein